MDTVRVLRILEYTGPRDEVETNINRSIQGTVFLSNGVTIRAATIGDYPEILEIGKSKPLVRFSLAVRISDGSWYMLHGLFNDLGYPISKTFKRREPGE